jgi:hypothetical protein
MQLNTTHANFKEWEEFEGIKIEGEKEDQDVV